VEKTKRETEPTPETIKPKEKRPRIFNSKH
jgi:hypothetical protein